MDYFIQSAIGNLVVVSVLSPLVLLYTRVWRNPHVAHALWLIILIKLITPPLFLVELPVWQGNGSTVVAIDDRVAEHPTSIPMTESITKPQDVKSHAPQSTDDRSTDLAANVVTNVERFKLLSNPPDEKATAGAAPIGHSQSLRVTLFVFLIWLFGAIISAGIVVLRFARFHRLVQKTPAAPTWITELTESLALNFELSSPQVQLFPGRIPPLVWPVPRPRILLPSGLVDDLKQNQLATVIAHELAHVKRKDYWIRYLEILLIVLHWWNPVFWLARRELRTAEEACCDLQVIQTMPKMRKQYGEAILQTAEFVTNQNASPAPATGFGVNYPLKRRIEMILSDRNAGRQFAACRYLVLACFAVVVLPITAIAVPQKKDSSRPLQEKAKLSERTETAKADVTEVAKRSQEKSITYDALVSPTQKARIFPRVGAYVDEVLVKTGDRVEKGQILVKLSNQELENEVRRQEAEQVHVRALAEQSSRSIDAARASFLQARAKLKEAKARVNASEGEVKLQSKELERVVELNKSHAISRSELIKVETEFAAAQSDLEVMKAQIDAAEALVEQHQALIGEAEAGKEAAKAKIAIAETQLRAAQIRLDHTMVRAPFAGVITMSRAVPGMLASPPSRDQTTPLFELLVVDTVTLMGNARASQLDRIKKGLPVEVAIHDFSKITGTISRISPIVDTVRGTIPVEVDLDNRNGNLKVGMRAKVTVKLEDK